MAICGVCISLSVDSLMICLPPAFPFPIWTSSQRIMSSRSELMEPAGPMLVILRNGISFTASSFSS